jgi:hypothetical protein
MTDTPNPEKCRALDSTQIYLEETWHPTMTQGVPKDIQKFSYILRPSLAQTETIVIPGTPETNNVDNFFDQSQSSQSEQDQARASIKFAYKSIFVTSIGQY